MSDVVPRRWRLPLIACLLLWGLVLGVYHQTAMDIVDVWERSNSYAHGWFVPPITLWLMWRRRDEVWARAPAAGFTGLLALALCAMLWVAGRLLAVNAAMQFAVAGMLIAVVPACVGWRAARPWAFPLLFLLLAVPFGDFMLPQLMDWTADFTVLAVRWTGIPVYREGLHFVIPSGSWSVAEACSGIRYMVASVMAGCLYGYLYFRSTWLRVAFLALSVSMALVANWLRAYIIVLLGHYSNNTIATGVDHLIYGWFFFALVLMLLFWIGSRWHDPLVQVERSPEAAVGTDMGAGTWSAWLVPAVSAVMVLGAAQALPLLQHSVSRQPVAVQSWAPAAGWRASAFPFAWSPEYDDASAQAHVALASPAGDIVGVHVHYFRLQGAQRKLVSSSHVLTSESNTHWMPVEIEQVGLQTQGQTLSVREEQLRSRERLTAEGRRLRAWQLYWVDGRWVGSPIRAKWAGAMQLLKAQGDDGALITVYTQDGPQARAVLTAFMQTQGAALMGALVSTQGRN